MDSLSISNFPRKAINGPALLHDLICGTHSENDIAIEYLAAHGERTCITYTSLNTLTDRLADRIRDTFGPSLNEGDIIPVLVPQAPELYISWIAILKAGAAFCPIAPDTPPERLDFILKDVSARVALCLPGSESVIRRCTAEVKPLSVSLTNLKDESNGLVVNGNHKQSLTKPSGDELAYVMYTSGSTGQPKAVLVPHRSASQALLAHDAPLPKFRRFLQFASPTFDVSVFETFFPLFRGATLISCERERMLADLPGTIRSLDVDAVELTPTVVGTLLRTREAAPCLKLLLTIGEMLTRRVIEEFGQSADRESMLFAMYGPTEASIHCTVAPCLSITSPVSAIGCPLATVTAFVLAESVDGTEGYPSILRYGQTGELAIAGQLALGYLNRPEKTAAAFIDLPKYGRVYRTGDRARMFRSGEIEILGRISVGQIKLRGQRVELGEIENVICRTPGVELAVVSVIDEVLIAFCVAGSVGLSSNDVLSTCKRWLPRFMRPGDIIILRDEIPRLPSGKIDRNALENHYRYDKTSTNNKNSIVDETEVNLLNQLSGELGTGIETSSSLWSHGLDSLKAIRLASRLRFSYPQITVSSILECDTFSHLARLLRTESSLPINVDESMLDSSVWIDAISQVREHLKAKNIWAPVAGILPCSNMQTAMLTETSATIGLNFNRINLKLSGSVSQVALAEAFRVCARHNEIIRSGFVSTKIIEMPFVQVVWKTLSLEENLDLLHPFHLTFSKDDPMSATVMIHHALYDGWSWDLIMADINSTLTGKTPLLRPQFRAVTAMQDQANSKNEAVRDYWQEILQDVSPSPFPSLSSQRATFSRKSRQIHVLNTSEDAMANSCNRLHISRQSIVCAAWTVLLSAYTDSSDIVSGIVTSGRTIPIAAIEEVIGPCINTAPLRVDLSRVQTVQDLLLYVHRLQLDLLRYEGMPLRDVKRNSGLKAADGLFDTLFVWQQGLQQQAPELQLVSTVDTLDSLDYAMVLEVEPKAAGLEAKITFETSKIPEQHAKLILDQLDYLVRLFIQRHDACLTDIWRNADIELLSKSNSVFELCEDAHHLTSRIEGFALSQPQSTALEFVEDYDPTTGSIRVERLTFWDLCQKAKLVCRELRTKWAVDQDHIVCIIADKSIDLYVTLLGVIFAGAAYMCVDPRTPLERTTDILREAKCKLLIGDRKQSLRNRVAGIRQCVMSDLTSSTPRSRIMQPNSSSGKDLAYVVFTSGSTGQPKGVLITRQNLKSNIDCLSRIYPCVTASDKLLQACSPAFDVSVFEIFWTWHMGMTLCAASNDVLFRDLEKFIVATNITHLSMTPSVAALVEPENVPSVKFLVTAGEPMNSKVFDSWAGRGLYQGYGPSETTNICNVRPNVAKDDMPNNVGPPLPNTLILICVRSREDEFNLLPIGAPGEIWVGGEQVGRGYVDLELTQKHFINHSEDGRWYRSGDIGKLLSDGSLVILGREDDQVKVRGQRIELGDINAAIVRTSFVVDAVTIISKQGGTERIISFWTQARNTNSKEGNPVLFRDLEAQLPSYMMPDALVRIKALPLTKQGKVDRRLLKANFELLPFDASSAYFRGSTSPDVDEKLSEKDVLIAEALSKVTGCSATSVKRSTSFFALGLDSINSIQLSRRLRELSFGQVDVSTILRHSTIERLMRVINGKSTNRSAVTSKRLENIFDLWATESIRTHYKELSFAVEAIFPCTPLQEAMLSAGEVSNSGAYQNELRFRINGDLAALEDVLASAISRHQILRTGFVLTNSARFPYAQVVLARVVSPWRVVGEGEPIPNEGFPNLELPPYRILVQREQRTGPMLVLQIHHALYDAEAMSCLLEDIEHMYFGKPLPDVVPFPVYLETMVDMDVEASDSFWHRYLADFQPKSLDESLDLSNFIGENPADIRLKRTMNIGLQNLQRTAQQSSTTVLSWLQVAWVRLLSCYFRSPDVCFGNVFSGRNLPVDGLERVIGPCFNTLPIRMHLNQRHSNQDIAKRLHDINLEILPFQPSSLRSIQKLQVKENMPLFDTILLFQTESKPLDPSLWILERDLGDMAFPTILEIVQNSSDDTLLITLHQNTEAHYAGEEILENFGNLLQHSVRYPEARAMDFSVIHDNIPNLRDSVPSQLQRNGIAGFASTSTERSAAWSEIELHIRKIFSSLSTVQPVNIRKDTSIFRLGLDSINVIQIAAKLRDSGFAVTRADVLDAPTVQELAMVCDLQRSATASGSSFDLDAFDEKHRVTLCRRLDLPGDKIQSVWPCTATQSGMIAQFIRSKGKLYFNSLSHNLDRSIDVVRFRNAWESVAERHEMLRTGFAQVEDSKHPFAMIIYLSGVHHIRWETDSASNPSPPASDQGDRYLNSLQVPPWHIALSSLRGVMVFKLSMLHSLYDAQALDQVFADVADTYYGRPFALPVPIGPTLATILAQAEDHNESRQFWQNNAADMQSTKFPDLRVSHCKSQKVSTVLFGCSLSRRQVDMACRKLGISLQIACQSTWAQLLAMYTGQSKVSFGVILSGRTSEVSLDSQCVFPNINTLPLGVGLTGDILEVLRNVGAQNAGLIRHQQTPFTSIKKWLNIEDDLFDTVFVLQKYRTAHRSESPWTAVADSAMAEYVASIEVIADPSKSIAFRLTIREDVVPVEQAEVMLSQFDALLTAIFRGQIDLPLPDTLLSVLPAKEETLKAPVLYLHQFVEERAQLAPEKTALEFATAIDGGEVTLSKWTYKQLDGEGNRIAQLLVRHGATPGTLVGICFDKCPEASFAILGVLKAGCAYVALDPGAPPARKNFILQDAACPLLLTTKNKCEDFETVDGVIVLAVDDNNVMSSLSTDPIALLLPLTRKHTCYCLYTSGTTGTPKGCLISHNSAVQAMMSFQRIFAGHWDENSRWLQFASFHFDVSVLEQYWSWSVGICVTSAPRDLMFQDLPGAIKALRITHLDLTPSLAKLLDPQELPDLCGGVFIVGGEQVGQEILDVWGDVGCLYNFYGPSEVTIGCTVHKRVPKSAKSTNIGQQWDNVGSFVLDPDSQKPVIRGAVGELCLSGPLVGKGYLNRKDLTEEKFIVLEKYKTRVYRTGDLVRLLHDDSFEFLGRIDDQVKLRGQRLETGEINHVIASAAPEIKDVATMVLKHPQHAKEQLVAFVSTRNTKRSQKPTFAFVEDATRARILRIGEHCASCLPGYMVPTYILLISSMPLSANNKVDGKSLRDMFGGIPLEKLQLLSMPPQQIKGNDVIDTTEETTKIVEVLTSFLNISPSGLNSSSRFFELGLDSIAVIAFSSALRRAGLAQAHPAAVMSSPTIGSLAQYLVNKEHSASQELAHQEAVQRIVGFGRRHLEQAAWLLGVSTDAIECIAPCTPLQESMIFSAYNESSPVYFSSFTFELDEFSASSLEKLGDTWSVVREKFQILRTHFVTTPEGSAQVVIKASKAASFAPVVFFADQVDAIGEETREESWERIGHGFERKACWEVRILRSRGQATTIRVSMFHGLYDGISLPLILEAVAGQIKGLKFPNSHSYHDALAYGPLCRAPGAEAFWKKNLQSVKLLDLPVKHKRSPRMRISKQEVVFTDTAALESMRQEIGVTMSAIFHAAWLLVLGQYFGVVPTMGMVVSGRSIALPEAGDAMRVVGPMFNTLPWSLKGLRSGSNFVDLVQICARFTQATLYQHTSLRDIARWTDKPSPHFDCLFVFQRSGDEVEALSVPGLWRLRESTSKPVCPLAIEVRQPHAYLDGDDSAGVGGSPPITISIVSDARFLDEQDLDPLARSLSTILAEVGRGRMQTPLPEAFHEDSLEPRDDSVLGTTEEGIEASSDFQWTPTSKRIRKQISVLSGREADQVTESTNIFQLGLDSIDAVRLSAALKGKGVTLSVRDIMRHPNIRQMMAHVGQVAQPSEPAVDLSEADHQLREYLTKEGHDLSDVEVVVPATPMQEGILADYARYYNFMQLSLRLDTNWERLQDALQAVFRHYPIFRTRFVEIDDPKAVASHALVVTGKGWIRWERGPDDGLSLVEDVVVAKRDRIGAEGLASPTIDISRVGGPDGRNVVLLGMSHAIYDAWSIELFHQAVAAAYNEQPLRTTVSWNKHLQSALCVMDEAKRFWEEYLADATPSVFPSAVESDLPLAVYKTSAIEMDQVRRCVEKTGITLHSLGLACWALVLARHLMRLDICFGVVMSGRTTEGADDLMFPTFNTVVFRLDVRERMRMGKGMTAAVMLRWVHEVGVEVSLYQQFPLRKALQLGGNGGGPLFNSLFVYQKTSVSAGKSGGEGDELPKLYDVVDWAADGQSLNPAYPVNIEMEVVGDRLQWTGVCEGEVLSREEMDQVLQDVDWVLQWLVGNCDTDTQIIMQVDAGGDVNGRVEICGLPAITLAEDEKHIVDRARRRTETARDYRIINDPASSDTKIAAGTDNETWSPMEVAIRDVLAAVANLDEKEASRKIGKHTSLFHLGVDSIGAIKVAGLLKRQNGISLPVREMMKALTVERMALAATKMNAEKGKGNGKLRDGSFADKILEAEPWAGEVVKHVPLDDVEDVMPATSGQLYMLGMWRASGGELFYPEFKWKMRRVGVQAIHDAWESLCSRLPILRTIFLVGGGDKVWQVVLKHSQYENFPRMLTVGDASEGGDVVEVKLKIHHALYDAVSLADITGELRDGHTETPASTYNTDLKRFVEMTQGPEEWLQQRRFWTQYLTDEEQQIYWPTPSSFLAAEDPQKVVATPTRVERYQCDLVPDVAQLRESAAAAGVSVPNVFIAAVARTYYDAIPSATTRKDDQDQQPIYVVVGVYLANRSFDMHSDCDADHLSAPTLNIVPVRVRVDDQANLLQTARDVQDDLAIIGRQEHCGVALRDIYEWTERRVVLDCVINFLVEVGSGTDGAGGAQGTPESVRDQGVDFTKSKSKLDSGYPRTTSQNQEAAQQTSRLATGQPSAESENKHAPSPFLGGDATAGGLDLRWCAPTVDIEAKVEDGRLAVGVFGYADEGGIVGKEGSMHKWTMMLKRAMNR